MIDTFASVGTTRFDVTRTNAASDKVSFKCGVSRSDLTRALPAMLDHATAHRLNVIMRPTGANATTSETTRIAGSVNFKDRYAPHYPGMTMRENTSRQYHLRRRA